MATDGGKRSGDLSNSGSGTVAPFLMGAAVGGVAGAVVGTLLSHHTTHLIAAVVASIDRRLHDADRDRLQFELLLQ